MTPETANALGVRFVDDDENIALLAERQPDNDDALKTPIQNDKINPRLEMRDGQFVFCMTNEAGGLVERYISAEQVRHAFTGIPIDSGWLPANVVRWGNGMIGEWAVGFIPPQVHELEFSSEGSPERCARCGACPSASVHTPSEHGHHPFEDKTWLDRIRVPLPGLVWFGIATQYWLWAVKTQKLEPYQEIYRAPLPNIYADGSICWGEVKPERMTAKTLFKAYDLFMGSTFNNHLANAKCKSERDDVRVKLRSLDITATGHHETNSPKFVPEPYKYPVNDLIRQVEGTGITLDQAISSYFETGSIPS